MTKYDSDFYATSRQGMIESAQALVPILMKELHIPNDARVVDVGCGEGHWAAEFATHGCEVIGIDGAWHERHPLGDRFLPHNLADPLPEHLAGRFDVVVCLEVAEHLWPRRAASFIDELCSLAPLVIFSAAIPGQGGTNHINERWPDYWAELFSENNFAADGSLRLDIWADDRIENWYRQNLLVAYGPFPGADGPPFDAPAPLRLVHPVLWEARR